MLDGRKLPIWFYAWDSYLSFKSCRLGSKCDAGGVIIEFHMCIWFPEFGCTIDELGESWGVKIDQIEESYLDVVELGSVDNGNEVL
jgi:hypothetical protein